MTIEDVKSIIALLISKRYTPFEHTCDECLQVCYLAVKQYDEITRLRNLIIAWAEAYEKWTAAPTPFSGGNMMAEIKDADEALLEEARRERS